MGLCMKMTKDLAMLAGGLRMRSDIAVSLHKNFCTINSIRNIRSKSWLRPRAMRGAVLHIDSFEKKGGTPMIEVTNAGRNTL